jgi:hypothetical protein
MKLFMLESKNVYEATGTDDNNNNMLMDDDVVIILFLIKKVGSTLSYLRFTYFNVVIVL